MNLHTRSLIVFLLIASCTKPVLFAQDVHHFKAVVELLADDAMGGRGIKSKGLKKSAAFISAGFKKSGLKPFSKKENSFSQFFFLPDSLKEFKGIRCENIIGVLNGNADSTIIIGAHYDHLDTCSLLSKEVFKAKRCAIHNGADDNASGVAMMLALADDLSKNKKTLKYNYVFIAYSAHEVGLYGSRFFFESDYFKKLNVKMLLNFDMLGRLDPESKLLRIGGLEKREGLKAFIAATEKKSAALAFLINDEQLMMSDATLFYKNGIPAITFTTGITGDYHRSTDDAGKINYSGMQSVFDFLVAFLNYMER